MVKLKELVNKAMPPEKKVKAKQDIFAYYVGRPITYLLSWPLVGTKISPNSITLFSYVFVILGAVFTCLFGNVYFLLIGWVSYFIWALLDGVDGNIARFRQQFSKIGSILDAIGGYLAMYLTFLSYGVAAYNYPGWITTNFNIPRILYVIIGSISGFALIFPRLVMHKIKSSVNKEKEETFKPIKMNNMIKLIAFNLTSITGFVEVFMLIICVLAIFNIYLFDVFTIVYCLINLLFMFASIFKLLMENK